MFAIVHRDPPRGNIGEGGGRWPVGAEKVISLPTSAAEECDADKGAAVVAMGLEGDADRSGGDTFCGSRGFAWKFTCVNRLSGLNDSGPQSIGSWFATAAYSYFAGRGERVTLRTRPACILSSIAVLNSGLS